MPSAGHGHVSAPADTVRPKTRRDIDGWKRRGTQAASHTRRIGRFGVGAALAAAREIIAQPDWRPVTVAELARKSGIDEATVRDHRAQLERELGVDEATIRRHRAQLESKSPGLFKPARRG
jgi:hypothetical protein